MNAHGSNGSTPLEQLGAALDYTMADLNAISSLYGAADGDPLEDSGWKRLAAFAVMVTDSRFPRDWKGYRDAVMHAIADCVQGDRNCDWVLNTGVAGAVEQVGQARRFGRLLLEAV